MTKTDKSKGERRLAVIAAGRNRPDLALDFIRGITKRGCQILDCHVHPLADCFSISLLISGNWSALGRLETALPKFADQLGFKISYEHSEETEVQDGNSRPYAVEVIAPARNDLLVQVLEFFQTQNLAVHELAAQDYSSIHTGAVMCTMSFVIHMPIDHHPQALRESFMDLCDELNADGIFDPIKN